MTTLTIIPARYHSSRFPGKPLALLHGKPVVQWVYEAAAQASDRVVVATDDERILNSVESFGGEAILTSGAHRSGTSRVSEAYKKLQSEADIIINLQGDEPLIRPEHIEALINSFADGNTFIATLARKIHTQAEIFDANTVKVVLDHKGDALCFTRAAVPYVRDFRPEEWIGSVPYYCHIGVYAFAASIFNQLCALPPAEIEQAESLEQLRWLYHGYKIHCALIDATLIGIDTPEDLKRAEGILA